MNCPYCDTDVDCQKGPGAMLLCPSCRKHFVPAVEQGAQVHASVSSGGTLPRNLLICAGIAVGLLMLVVGALMTKALLISGSRSAVSEMPVQDVLAVVCQAALNEDKQKIFDKVHPFGTATSIKLHEVHVDSWKSGRTKNAIDSVKGFTITYTLYWAGPLTKDGYTKIEQTYDAEVERYVSGRILKTNGTTNQEISDTMFTFGATLLLDSLRGN